MEFSLQEAIRNFKDEEGDASHIIPQVETSLKYLAQYMGDNFLEIMQEYKEFKDRVGTNNYRYMDPATERMYDNRMDVPLNAKGLLEYKVIPCFSKCKTQEESDLADEERNRLVEMAVRKRDETKELFFKSLSDNIEGWWV